MDTNGQIPAHVQALLRERVRSVEELECLLLLFAQPARFWSEAQIASELRLNPQLVSSAVRSLLAEGLLRVTDKQLLTFSRDASANATVSELAEVYQAQRVEVLVFLSQLAISRVRSNALRTFAEAFQIPGKKKDG